MAKRKGYSSGQWGTFKQWLAEGGCVRKGEKACPVIFWKFLSVKTKEGDDSTDTETEKKVPMLRYYYVFNRDQVDGLPARSIPSTTPFSNPDPDLAEVRAFYQKILGTWEENPNIPFAHYDRRGDKVVMFPLGMCKSSPHFYHTLGHESAHWSGAPHRLNRTKGRKFGDCFYAFEELVAELTSTFLSAALGLPQMDQLQESSVKYLNTWIKALKEDPRVLLSVASKGQEAFDFLMNAGGKAEIEEESFEDERAAA
jgi:antirestriction protein ArdC